MKTGYRAITLAALLLLMLGCSSGEDEAPTPTPTAEPTPTVQPSPAAWTADGIISEGEYASSQTHGGHEVHWTTDGQYIYAALRATTSGWVAVAVQPGQRMKNADMVFGFVSDGETTVIDMFSTGDFGPHPPDEDQGGTNDILEYGGTEVNGVTTIEFKRALVTGDDYDNDLKPGPNKIIWSYGSNDDPSQKHVERGYGELDL